MNEESDSMRAELQSYEKMKTDEILSLNNKISKLKKTLEELENENLTLQAGLENNSQNLSQKALEHGHVRDLKICLSFFEERKKVFWFLC